MASRRDRLTGNTSTTTATTAKRPKRKPSSNKPKKSRSNSGTPSTPQPPKTPVGYFDDAAVGTSTGPYDPNATYGRTPTNPDIGTYQEWLAAEGYGNKGKLKKNKRSRLQDQYNAAKGPQGEYATTPEGEQMSNEDPDRYYSWLMGEAGGMTGAIPQYGGPTAFGQFLANDYKGYTNEGYEAAKMQSGGNLNYADYMTSIGWAPNQQQNTLLGAGTPPRDTGNPFTSSSMPLLGSVAAPKASPLTGAVGNAFGGQQAATGQSPFGALSALGGPSTNTGRSALGPLANLNKPPELPAIPGVDGLASARKMFNALTPQQRGINTSTANRPGRWAVYG